MSELVFVYGTLMEGHGNHHFLVGLTGQKAVAQGLKRIWPKDLFPVVEWDDKSSVEGELYYVNEKTLKLLDQLEGVPHMYERIKINVLLANSSDTTPFEAWVYYPTRTMLERWKMRIEIQELKKSVGNLLFFDEDENIDFTTR